MIFHEGVGIMAKVRVKIVAEVKAECTELYICGSTKTLGAWDAANARKMKYNAETNTYSTVKFFEEGETVEFKLLSNLDWANVEKGMFNEEIENHTLVAEKKLSLEVVVYNFA